VVIAGAGPTGLTAAVRLTDLGIATVVLDAVAAPTRTSNAALLHASSLELLAELGAVSRIGPLRHLVTMGITGLSRSPLRHDLRTIRTIRSSDRVPDQEPAARAPAGRLPARPAGRPQPR
jgi:2-polyprenyl-6-methoxyphenol hydroxylase-like FAD-dependent oxidoreductase